jgi:uncharacterized protein with PIN domain
MLGTLAKWLRILGYDTLYDPRLDDHQLVRLARAEDRILLTRDRPLAGRRGLRVLLIAGQELDEQLRQVLVELELEPDRAYSRCPVCNGLLEAISHEEARAQVPPYVARTHTQFKHCSSCGRIYWQGTHWQQMEEHLSRLRAAGTSQNSKHFGG